MFSTKAYTKVDIALKKKPLTPSEPIDQKCKQKINTPTPSQGKHILVIREFSSKIKYLSKAHSNYFSRAPSSSFKR